MQAGIEIFHLQGRQEFHHPVGFIKVKLPGPEQAAAVIDDIPDPGFQRRRQLFQSTVRGAARRPVRDEAPDMISGLFTVQAPGQVTQEQCQAGLVPAFRIHLHEQYTAGAGQTHPVQVFFPIAVQRIAHRVGARCELHLQIAVMDVVLLQYNGLGQDIQQVPDDNGECLHVRLRHPVRIDAVYFDGPHQGACIRKHKPVTGSERAVIIVDGFSVHLIHALCCP